MIDAEKYNPSLLKLFTLTVYNKKTYVLTKYSHNLNKYVSSFFSSIIYCPTKRKKFYQHKNSIKFQKL